MKQGTERTTQDSAERLAAWLDELNGKVYYVLTELEHNLMRCGGDVRKNVCGTLRGIAGLLEQFTQNIDAMACGEPRAGLPTFAGAVAAALGKPAPAPAPFRRGASAPRDPSIKRVS